MVHLIHYFLFQSVLISYGSLLMVALGVICVPTTIYFDRLMQLKLFTTLNAACHECWPFHFLIINLLKLANLVVNNHLVGKQINVCIFRICNKSASKWVKNKFLHKNISMQAYELRDLCNWNFVANIYKAKLKNLSKLLQKRMVAFLFIDVLNIVTHHSSNFWFFLKRSNNTG